MLSLAELIKNLIYLVGRDIQREYGIEPQVILTMPLLVGIDGVEKMSKSYDNYIGISDEPSQIFGRTLSIPDNLIYQYFELATNVSNQKLTEIKSQLADGNANPRDIKRELARTLSNNVSQSGSSRNCSSRI